MSDRDYRDHYDVLGLTPEADGITVNRTYWHLARKYQALAVSDPRAQAMIDELNQAYTVLGTPRLREEYDASRATTVPAVSARASDAAVPQRRRPLVPEPARTASSPAPPGPGAHVDAQPAPRRRWSAYAGVVAVAAASIALGVVTGSATLAALIGSAGMALAFAPTRNALLQAWGSGVARARDGRRASAAPVPRPRAARAPELRPMRPVAPVDDLRTSTASMVSRWRTATDAAPHAGDQQRAPDSTLVDIFRSEQEVETASEPLSAVLDILRGTNHPIESR